MHQQHPGPAPRIGVFIFLYYSLSRPFSLTVTGLESLKDSANHFL